jgi:hypothetical protein
MKMNMIKLLLVLSIALVSGCFQEATPEQIKKNKEDRNQTLYDWKIFCFEDSGHKFISNHNGGLIHHPDCQCFKIKQAEHLVP